MRRIGYTVRVRLHVLAASLGIRCHHRVTPLEAHCWLTRTYRDPEGELELSPFEPRSRMGTYFAMENPSLWLDSDEIEAVKRTRCPSTNRWREFRA